MADRDDVPTAKQSSTLQKRAEFAELAHALARRAAALRSRFSSVRETNVRRGILAGRIMDEASLLAIAFESWSKLQTTSDERSEVARRLLALDQAADDLEKEANAELVARGLR